MHKSFDGISGLVQDYVDLRGFLGGRRSGSRAAVAWGRFSLGLDHTHAALGPETSPGSG